MPYFLSNRTSLYYESGGQGPTLLLISPPGVGTAIFELKDRFHVVTFDPRGNGKSQKGNIGDYTMEDWTDDMLALINHLNEKQVILCGYSLGGLPAQMFAIKYPRKTASLILINSFPLVNTFLLNVKFNLGIWSTYEDIRGILGKGLAFSHTKKKNQQRHIRTSVEASDPHVLKCMYKNGKSLIV
ncbi:alpha/beta fold hydrolase [Salibacterium aidingense]|uniref:alpha/beta fold hydrolase n=1 Tax=Salibacterium aidingense TaxID=384933 RepID=UPI00042A31E0|nr:alpha/beta hydrolase [Salibacterium aidingense]